MEANNFSELKNLWQTQKMNNSGNLNIDKQFADLLNKYKLYVKTERWIYYFKVFLLTVFLPIFIWAISLLPVMPLFAIIGAAIILLSSIAYAAVCWRKRFKTASIDSTIASSEFIISAIKELKGEEKIHVLYTPLIQLSFIIGFNLFVYGENTVTYAAPGHKEYIFYNTLFVIVFCLGFLRRKTYYKKNVLPLLAVLEKINIDLNEKDN